MMKEWYSQDMQQIALNNDQRIRQQAAQRAMLAAMHPARTKHVNWAQKGLGWAGELLVSAGLRLQRAAR